MSKSIITPEQTQLELRRQAMIRQQLALAELLKRTAARGMKQILQNSNLDPNQREELNNLMLNDSSLAKLVQKS